MISDLQGVAATLSPVLAAIWTAVLAALGSSKAAWWACGLGIGLLLRADVRSWTAGDVVKALLLGVGFFTLVAIVGSFISGGA